MLEPSRRLEQSQSDIRKISLEQQNVAPLYKRDNHGAFNEPKVSRIFFLQQILEPACAKEHQIGLVEHEKSPQRRAGTKRLRR